MDGDINGKSNEGKNFLPQQSHLYTDTNDEGGECWGGTLISDSERVIHRELMKK